MTRRLLTIPAVLLLAALLTATLPLWLPLAALVSLAPATRGALRMLLFVTAYLWCETVGILGSAWLWLRHAAPARGGPRWPAFVAGNVVLQHWWAHSLKRAAEHIFDLRFHVDGEAALAGPPALVMPRHTSIGDTVVPIVWYAMVRGFSLRYVLKKELQFDPSLDIVGNRLPNRFVDRESDDPASEIAGVATLLEGLAAHEGVVIYPEGTRYTPAKRAQVLARYRARGDGEALARAERWPNLLPPRLGGSLALLAANPGLDVLFIAHSGFEGSARMNDLVNGAWAHSDMRIRFWRVPFAEVPKDEAGARAFLFTQWERMAREVAALEALNRPGREA
jgi:1-acyl-sn-glycerol-3-phosphate acyltransferase